MNMPSDPNLTNIILGVSANILTSILTWTTEGARRVLVGKKEPKQTTQHLIERASEKVSDTFTWKGPGQLELVCLFLTSPETTTILRQIFSLKISKNDAQITIADIKEEFILSLSAFLNVTRNEIEPQGNLLFLEFTIACDNLLKIAIDSGILSAHESNSILRHNIILDELSSIKANIAFLNTHTTINISDILSFEINYRKQLVERHAHIIPPNFDTARRVPINNLYVTPKVSTASKEKSNEAQSLTIDEVTSNIKRTVLLGTPGGGKSTFAQKITHAFAGNSVTSSLTPILIVIRDYSATKKTHHYSLLQFIESNANSIYQITPPSGAFEYLLRYGRAFVIFDGLDELLDTNHRQEIAKDIESFCNRFPEIRVLVTSRLVGYEQAPLDKQRFEAVSLEPFNDSQVKEYVTKWFSIDEYLSPEQTTSKANAFFKESRIVGDLCTNPLMLALMCNIYRGESYIPTNRPDIYEKCAIMLFERWDKGRGIRVSLPIDAHIRPAMMHLAYWIYSDETLQSGVTEARLISKTTDYLCPKRFEDRDEAETVAKQFIEFCRGRAWVFTDTGTTKEGDRLYQFTHRTFLEYFSAAQLVRTNPTPDKLLPIILPRIEKREWDVVAQLAFQIQNKNIESAGDELLSELTSTAISLPVDSRWNLLSFAARCLEFIIPSPKVCRSLSNLCIESFLSRDLKKKDKTSLNPSEVLAALLKANPENIRTIKSSLETDLVHRINTSEESLAILATELSLHITFSHGTESHTNDWDYFPKKIMESCWPRIELLAEKDKRLAIDAFWHDKWPISKVADLFGAEILFYSLQFRVFTSISSSALIEWLISLELRPPRNAKISTILTEVARWLLERQTPWIKASIEFPMQKWIGFPFTYMQGYEQINAPNSNIAFVTFSCIAVSVEKSGLQFGEVFNKLTEFKNPLVSDLLPIIGARFNAIDEALVQTCITKLKFSEPQINFIRKWINKEISVVEIVRKRSESTQSLR
jgi:hypothetical protein